MSDVTTISSLIKPFSACLWNILREIGYIRLGKNVVYLDKFLLSSMLYKCGWFVAVLITKFLQGEQIFKLKHRRQNLSAKVHPFFWVEFYWSTMNLDWTGPYSCGFTTQPAVVRLTSDTARRWHFPQISFKEHDFVSEMAWPFSGRTSHAFSNRKTLNNTFEE